MFLQVFLTLLWTQQKDEEAGFMCLRGSTCLLLPTGVGSCCLIGKRWLVEVWGGECGVVPVDQIVNKIQKKTTTKQPAPELKKIVLKTWPRLFV